MLKDENGEDFFNVIMIDLVCSSCRRLPKSKWQDCRHLDDTILPPWKSKDKNIRAKTLQTADPNSGRNARESMGIITGDYNRALPEDYIRKTFEFETRKYHEVTHDPPRIYICMDPDGGGQSRLSVISGFICRGDTIVKELPGTLVVTGIDFGKCDQNVHDEQTQMVKAHIRKLRENKRFERSKIILIPENMTGDFHSRIERKCTRERNCICFHEYNEAKSGVRKDGTKSAEYVMRMTDMLSAGLVKFDYEWFTNTTNQNNTAQDIKEFVLGELMGEMLRYCYDEKGKLTGKINGAQDDLCIGFMMLCYFGSVIEHSPMYAHYLVATM